MTGHLEDSHDAEDSQRLSNSLDGVKLVDKGGEVVWKNGKEVNDVHEAPDKLAVVGAGEEPDNELNGEPGHVDCLQNINHRVMVYNENIEVIYVRLF